MVPSQGTCRACLANMTLVQTEHFCDLKAATTTSPLTPGIWAVIIIGALILIALIAVLIIHRRIMRRRRRLATEKFAENAGLRVARNDADRADLGSKEMAAMAGRTEQKLRASGSTVEYLSSETDVNYNNNNPFRHRAFADNDFADLQMTPVQPPAAAWQESEYMRPTGPEMIPMQRYGGTA